MTKLKQAVLYADSDRGVYIPQFFAQSFDRNKWRFISEGDIDGLLQGPDNPDYWQIWDSVINHAETIDGGILHHNDDLWVIYAQDAIDTVNGCIASQVKYRETHIDAGDAYAHLPCEGDSCDQIRRLAEYVATDCGIALDSDALDSLHDECLELFEMRSGSIYWASVVPDDGFILDSYGISEHEIQIDPGSIGIDSITWEYIRESRDIDAHISGEFAYVSTDAVWYAVVPGEVMRELVSEAMDSQDIRRICELLNPWSYHGSVKDAVIRDALEEYPQFKDAVFSDDGEELYLIDDSNPDNNARYVARLEGSGIGNEQWGVDAVNQALAGKISRPFGGWE